MEEEHSSPESAPVQEAETATAALTEPVEEKKKAKNPMTQKQKDALAKARETRLAKRKLEKETEEAPSVSPLRAVKKSHKAQDQATVSSHSNKKSKPAEPSSSEESSEEEVVVKKKKKAPVVKKTKKRIVYVSDSSSDEDQVIVKKKRAPAKKRISPPAAAVAYTEPHRPEIPHQPPQYPRYVYSRIFG